jgi:phage shock protein C
MLRSFSHRVIAGVCAGIGETFRVNPWLIRFICVGLTAASLGFGILVYITVWWLMPQRLPATRQRGGFVGTILVILTVAGMAGLWAAQAQSAVWLQTASGQPLFLPLVLLVMGVAFLLRQVRTAA